MSKVDKNHRRRTSAVSRGPTGYSTVDHVTMDRRYRNTSRALGRPNSPNSRIANLCDRIQSMSRSSISASAGPLQQAAPLEMDAFDEPNCPLSPEAEVVLNLQIMEKEMGLRPAQFARRPSHSGSNVTTHRGTLRNEPETTVEETNNPPLTVDDKGQVRYFGYSSYMRMVSVLPQSKSSPTERASNSPLDKSLDSMEGEAMADSPETQMRLIDLFFKYQNAAIPILDEEAFRSGYMTGERSDYFSRFLLYSLLLRALNFDDDRQHRETLATIYTRRAKAKLLFELENPTIATIPGLCLFGYYLGGVGGDSWRACWLYPGIAYRLVFDFGLHEDCRKLVAAGLLTEVDQRVRRITLYGCYVLDKLYSSYQGRPTAIHLDDLNVSQLSAQPVGATDQLVAAWIGLASVLNDILSIITGAPEKIYQNSSVKKLSEVSRKLLAWFMNLPQELQLDADRPIPPGVCALHIQFLATMILLNRPFATYIFNRGNKSVSQRPCLEGQTTDLSQQICTANPIRISKLLLTYRRQHGASKVFTTINPACLSAAVALISDIVSAKPGEDKEPEKTWLAAIMETLEEIIPWYPVAQQSRNTLAAIMKFCGLSDIINDLSSSQGNAPVEMLPDHGPTEAPGAGGNMVADWSFDLGFPFDSVYDVHDISLTGFYAQPCR